MVEPAGKDVAVDQQVVDFSARVVRDPIVAADERMLGEFASEGEDLSLPTFGLVDQELCDPVGEDQKRQA